MSDRKLTMLVIMDGWGLTEPGPGNAISLAHTPNLDRLWSVMPHTSLTCHGESVGLPKGQMGNSEVGHLNLGAGRVVFQDILKISNDVETGEFFENRALTGLMNETAHKGGAVHLLGLVSNGGVHSSPDHLHALIDMAARQGVGQLFLHAFMDGRDTSPHSGKNSLKEVMDVMAEHGIGQIASLGGRYWGMDRDKRWNRVQRHYNALVHGHGRTATDPMRAIAESYANGVTDEFIEPTTLVNASGQAVGPISDGDGVVFFNFRADRAREMTQALTEPGFDRFETGPRPKLTGYVTMTSYGRSCDLPAAFPPVIHHAILGEVISEAGLTQLHIAETEKYAHVTYFFNGGREDAFAGEDRKLIASPQEVSTYDQKPVMSADEVTDEVTKCINDGVYDFIVLNFANGDMVGHTGVISAAVTACEEVDRCVGRIVEAVNQMGGTLLITSDHGNAEQMLDDQGNPYTAHTVSNPVPLIIVGRNTARLADGGALCDVAPTILDLMDLPKPHQMTGRSLLEFE